MRAPAARAERVEAPREALEEALSRYFGRPAQVAAVDSERLEARSSYPVDRLWVTLGSGEQLPVIFKRLERAAAREERLPKGCAREVLVYRKLLAGGRFGAPGLYGSVYDPARQRYWLFLEDVGEETLERGDWKAWMQAVRWLAGMHATYQGCEVELRALGCLEEHGAAYYHAVARAARANLLAAGAEAALTRFDTLMTRFDDVMADLLCEPRTLVHGDIFPANLHLQPGPRIRPIDWESAAIGVGAWDVARLLDGWEGEEARFLAVYRSEFNRLAPLPLDWEGFQRAFARCSGILNPLLHLGWSAAACADGAFVRACLDSLGSAGHGMEEA